jgi:hypothetical protein
MIAQSSCKTIWYNQWFAADGLVSYCCGHRYCVVRLQFSRFTRCNQGRLVKLNLLEGLRLTN